MYVYISTTMASRIFMDGCYYLMDAFHFLILFVVSGMAAFCIDCSPTLLVGDGTQSYAIVEFFGQPRWMTAA